MEEDPGRHIREACLPALPVGMAAAAFPDVLFSSAAELKMKKRVIKDQTSDASGLRWGFGPIPSPNDAFDNSLVEFDGVFPQVWLQRTLGESRLPPPQI